MRVLEGGQTIQIGDGERLENTLIKAQGEEVKITAHGDGWVMKNVGIEGPVDNPDDKILAPSVSEGGTGRIEHCYIGGEIAKNTNHMFVHTKHAGHLEIVDSFFGILDPDPDTISGEDVLYASPPGNPENSRKTTGKGGTVDVIRSYAGGAWNYGFRLGSDGSRIVDSVVNVPSSKGVGLGNLYGTDVVVKNCDVRAGNVGLRIGDHDRDNVKNIGYQPSVQVENVRIDAPEPVQRNETGGGRSQLHGDVADSPDLTPPETVPRTAKEAAQGTQDRNQGQGQSQSQNRNRGQDQNRDKGRDQDTGQSQEQEQGQNQGRNRSRGPDGKKSNEAPQGNQGRNSDGERDRSQNDQGRKKSNEARQETDRSQSQNGGIETVDDFLEAVGLSVDSPFERAAAALMGSDDDVDLPDGTDKPDRSTDENEEK